MAPPSVGEHLDSSINAIELNAISENGVDNHNGITFRDRSSPSGICVRLQTVGFVDIVGYSPSVPEPRSRRLPQFLQELGSRSEVRNNHSRPEGVIKTFGQPVRSSGRTVGEISFRPSRSVEIVVAAPR